jgi:putative ABC transport system ATP-binding protein
MSNVSRRGIVRCRIASAGEKSLTRPPSMSSAVNPTAPSSGTTRAREPLFHVRDLARVYGEGTAAVTALRGVALDLYAGELIVLLGASGSGKSTLLNQLGGLDSPTHGTLLYRGENLAAFDEPALTNFRRDSVGFVFQAYNLIPSLTARENVALITEICRDPMAPEAALGLVGLSDRMDHFPAQLSGGEQQRVAIARAIAKRPEVLLCDEPTGALDVRTGVTVLEAVERINRELGTLAVIITHNAILADMADRVFTLSDGRIVNVRENQKRGSVRDLAW